ncbi:tRNA lysidine(34) synthetase TilS [Neptunomonas antarctica]|uniref:tRNA(Ile)-lysidine synthase n=1 Tax=Neptunomonas antarctica TaxID=619304 RepID=A0A1N7J989_9GAMM|nr:tRNA lysidine(34) synthetase TilS [Neptunomonas antarctica]SIS45909.1 tRNA(Ile)-lysidine synthase [Neptunomonas antarctica]
MSHSPLIAAFVESCEKHPCQRWVVALSGGLDSIVMLHLAASYLPRNTLHVLHINHHLQKSADDWSVFCRAQAENLSIPFTQIDVYPNNSSEAAARDARYLAFSDFVQATDVLLLAHHADDQAETVLFRLLRGSGLRGLSGIPVSRSIGAAEIVRPLLTISRHSLEAWARDEQLSWIEDPSNQHEVYDRNFLRLKVLPVLKQRWPGVIARMSSTSRLLDEEQRLLDRYLDDELQTLIFKRDCINGRALETFSSFKRKTLLRRWIYNAKGQLLNEVQLEQLDVDFFQAAPDKSPEYALKSGWIRRYRSNLYICSALDKDQDDQSAINSLALTLGFLDWPGGVLRVESGHGASARLKTLDNVVCVKRVDGMSCRPAGRSRKTLKKLFQEASIPPWQRKNWPVCMVAEEIVAIPGICICEGWLASSAEKQGFCVIWEPF